VDVLIPRLNGEEYELISELSLEMKTRQENREEKREYE
jgi:hypothetical protein